MSDSDFIIATFFSIKTTLIYLKQVKYNSKPIGYESVILLQNYFSLLVFLKLLFLSCSNLKYFLIIQFSYFLIKPESPGYRIYLDHHQILLPLIRKCLTYSSRKFLIFISHNSNFISKSILLNYLIHKIEMEPSFPDRHISFLKNRLLKLDHFPFFFFKQLFFFQQ